MENEEGLEFITITYKDNVIIFHFNTPEEAEEWSKKIKLVKLRNVDPLESISERESSTFSPSDPSDFRAETNSLPPPPPDMDDTLVDGEDFAPPPQPEEIVKEPKSRTEASRRVVSYDKDFILAAQKLLLRGEKFVKYKHGRPKKRTIWVPVELDRIYWGSNDKLKAKGFIEIKEIEDIIDGCRGASKQGLAFSIVTPNRTLELEAYSTNMKKNWISAIRYAVDRLHSSG